MGPEMAAFYVFHVLFQVVNVVCWCGSDGVTLGALQGHMHEMCIEQTNH